MKKRIYKQGGATLIVALIMLVLLTLLVLASLNMGKASLQTVGNMQQRNEAYGAAQDAIEQAISNTTFFGTPNNVIPNPCDGTPNKLCFDTNGDGTKDVTVMLNPAPACLTATPLKNSDLRVSNTDGSINQNELACARSKNPEDFALENPADNSMCADSLWEINAEATDSVTQAKVELTQGVRVRVSTDAVAAACPN